jgi:hypothetical protein
MGSTAGVVINFCLSILNKLACRNADVKFYQHNFEYDYIPVILKFYFDLIQ